MTPNHYSAMKVSQRMEKRTLGEKKPIKPGSPEFAVMQWDYKVTRANSIVADGKNELCREHNNCHV